MSAQITANLGVQQIPVGPAPWSFRSRARRIPVDLEAGIHRSPVERDAFSRFYGSPRAPFTRATLSMSPASAGHGFRAVQQIPVC